MMLGANSALSPVVTFMTLQFTLMARECFDALQNWSDEHSYVKVILAGRSSGEITDEEAAQKVLAEYFEKNPDHLPTSNGRRFFCIASYDQRAIIKFSIQQNLYDLSTIFTPLRFFLDRNGGKGQNAQRLVDASKRIVFFNKTGPPNQSYRRALECEHERPTRL